jgi:rhamnose transport system ATP-binding protein
LHTAFRNVVQPVRELSGGNQQKVALSKWLLTEPAVLILDEPTRGVDVGAKEEVHRIIRSLADGGMAILLVSSDLPELLALSDRILVMREGALIATFSHDDATPENVMSAATGQEPDAA